MTKQTCYQWICSAPTQKERYQRAVHCWKLGEIKEWEIKYVAK